MNRSAQKIHRYAKAMLDVAMQENNVEAVRSDLEQVRRWLDEAPAFHVFAACDRFGNREVRLRALLELARAAGLGRLTAEFLARIEAAQELEHLGEILTEFERLRRERSGIIRAEIVSARPLTEDQKAELARRFGLEDAPKIEHLGEIMAEFERVRKRAGAVEDRSLTEDSKAELARRFGEQSGGKRMEISYKEDPGILGGFVARIGEQIHDYSVSGRLARLRRRLVDA